MTDTCPHCSVDLRGKPIPEKTRHLYHGHTHFSLREQVIDAYGGFVGWQCSKCKGKLDPGR